MNRVVFLIICASLLQACASNINLRNAEVHYKNGEAAMLAGNWNQARRSYAKSVVNANLGNTPTRTKSVINYEYGRALGATCYFEEAEKYLKVSLELDESSNGPIHYPLIELGRLSLNQEQYGKSAGYFSRVLPVVEKLGAENLDPIGFADLLEELSLSLENSGKNSEAETHRERASSIRRENSGAISRTDRTPYGRHCNDAS